MMRALLALWLVVALAPPLWAHSLGIDRAELTETAKGEYRLVSRVPARIAPAIRTPSLPKGCTATGKPAGERGTYSVTFTFVCDPALTADQTLVLPWQREGVLLTATWLDQAPVTNLARREGAAITVNLGDWLAGSGSIWRTASRYTVLGVEHILEGVTKCVSCMGAYVVACDK